MWTRKCSQYIALLHWDCKKRGNGLKCQRNNNKQSIFSLQLMLNLVWTSQKIVIVGKKNKNFVFFSSTWRFKNQKIRLDGVITLSQKTLSAEVEKKNGKLFSKWKEHVIPKEKEKTHWGWKHTQCYRHTSTVLFVSFNFSIRNGLLFHSGHLRVERAEYTTTHVWSLCRSTNRVINLTKATLD